MRQTTNPKKASHQDWHPADIVAAIHKRGMTLRKLGALHGITGRAVIAALRERNLPSEQRIAEAIGIPAQQIWPSRYNPDGTRTDLRKVTRRAAGVNGNNRMGA